MKEIRFFYVPDATSRDEMPEEEAMHALRVLRLKSGDTMMITDGCGNFYEAEITLAATRRCLYKILRTMPQTKPWRGNIRLVVSPTKMMERMEWMVEKATEIGFDRVSFLNCDNSERRVVKTKRLEKIVVAAMKQSRKAEKPIIDEIESFDMFISRPCNGAKYIAHCYEEVERTDFFNDVMSIDKDEEVTVLIGPEGDFSMEEVNKAIQAGFKSVTLGNCRLRTETAALSAVMMANLAKRR